MIYNFHDGDQNKFQALSVAEWEKTQGLRTFISELYSEADFPSNENFGSYWNSNKNSVEEVAEKDLQIPAVTVELDSHKDQKQSLG